MRDGELLTVPMRAGRKVVAAGALLASQLLGLDAFVRFCKARSLDVSRKRLIRLERLGVFAPVFRVRTPKGDVPAFRIPPEDSTNWFTKRWAIDTTSVAGKWVIPAHDDIMHEAYYSRFQVFHLEMVLSWLRVEVQLDDLVEQAEGGDIDWQARGDTWLNHGRATVTGLREDEHRRAVALLCQHISNRYYPESQTDRRTVLVPKGRHYSDRWVDVGSLAWDWYEEVRSWDPRKTERLYNLSPAKLRHAYEGLAHAQSHCDPVERWHELVQFVKVAERERLKGDALRAETLRAGAHMLRRLYRDLYNEELLEPHEVGRTVLKPLPEREMRGDVRRHLEFVANRFGVNPQPRLSLIVEGRSEAVAVVRIFGEYYGAHPGVYGIEIIPLGGVDQTTGGKADRFRAIIRLVDYLHSHQTFTLLILDNEGHAKNLRVKMKGASSIHTAGRQVTRPEYIKIWKDSFEFDNFSCTEIAGALSELAGRGAQFTTQDVAGAKSKRDSGAAVKKLYADRTKGRSLDKVGLVQILTDTLLSPTTHRRPRASGSSPTRGRLPPYANASPNWPPRWTRSGCFGRCGRISSASSTSPTGRSRSRRTRPSLRSSSSSPACAPPGRKEKRGRRPGRLRNRSASGGGRIRWSRSRNSCMRGSKPSRGAPATNCSNASRRRIRASTRTAFCTPCSGGSRAGAGKRRQRWCSASCRSWSPSPTWNRAVEPGSRGRERRGSCRVKALARLLRCATALRVTRQDPRRGGW